MACQDRGNGARNPLRFEEQKPFTEYMFFCLKLVNELNERQHAMPLDETRVYATSHAKLDHCSILFLVLSSFIYTSMTRFWEAIWEHLLNRVNKAFKLMRCRALSFSVY